MVCCDQLFDAGKSLLPEFSKYKLSGQLRPINAVARRSFRAIPGNRANGAVKACRCDIKVSVSTVLNPIFSKKVQGQKHPGRWGIVEHQIPSIKVLFKTNTKGHKHPSIRLISKSKTQLVNQRKQKVAFSPGTAHSLEIQSYRTDGVQLRQYWMTLPLYIYIRPVTELI